MRELTPAELAEVLGEAGLELQPYQQTILDRVLGMPVRAFRDDDTLYLFDEQAFRPKPPTIHFISTPDPDHDWWARYMRNQKYQPLWVNPKPVEFERFWMNTWVDEARVPPRPSRTEIARWEDDGGR